MFSMFLHSGKESASKSGGGHEIVKLSRGENELRKCLGNDTKECLIKSYACAWQREILVQGHLNITPNCFCFYSSILGWESKTSIWCKDIISIEKQTTAIVFPTAITITTESEKFTFASFLHRNRAHQVLTRVWEDALQDHPLSTEELIQVLKDMKQKNKRKNKDKGSPSLLRRSPLLRTNTSGSYVADSSDLDISARSLANGDSPPSITQRNLSNASASLSLPSNSLHQSLPVSRSSSQTTSTEATDVGEMPSIGAEAAEVYAAIESLSGSSDTDAGSSVKKPKRTPSPVQELRGTESSETDTETGEEGNVKSPGRRGSSKSQGAAESVQGNSERLKDEFRRFSTFLAQKLYSLWAHFCTPSNFINFLIIISIFLLLVSTLSMICKLSHMEPTLKPLLPWQPWCRLCAAGGDCDGDMASQSHSGASNADEQISLLTKDAFDRLVAVNTKQDSDSSHILRHSPPTLPTDKFKAKV